MQTNKVERGANVHKVFVVFLVGHFCLINPEHGDENGGHTDVEGDFAP